MWLRGVLAELDFLNSQSVEDLALNPVYYKRSKHIEIKYHWVREHADPEGEFRTATLIHVRTGEQTADIFTKALTGTAFDTHRRRMFGTVLKTQRGSVVEPSRLAVGFFYPFCVFLT